MVISRVMSDFNGHVGTFTNGYDGVHGGFGWGQRNRDGERMLDLADSCDLLVGNTFFKKDAEKLITYKSGDRATMIDHMLVLKTVLKNVKDIKIIPGEECFTQYRLLAMDFLLEIDTIKKVKKSEKIKL